MGCDGIGIGQIRFEAAFQVLDAKVKSEAVSHSQVCHRQQGRIGPQLVLLRLVGHPEGYVGGKQPLAYLVVADQLLREREPVGGVVGEDVHKI